MHLRLEYYNENDLKEIITRTADVLGTGIDEESALELARRSRGTPRVANRLLKRVRDFQQVNEDDQIYIETTKRALQLLQVDKEGLDYIDHKMMNCIINQYNGGPVGLDTIAVSIGEERITIEDVYEPFLIQKAFRANTTWTKSDAFLTSILIIRMKRGSKLNIEEFDYHLPESLIAQTPLKIETKVVCLCFKERLVK